VSSSSSTRAPRTLRDDLAGIELDKHGRVHLQVFHGDGETEIVEDEELKFEVVEFGEGEASDL
jgi:hypothetical protein